MNVDEYSKKLNEVVYWLDNQASDEEIEEIHQKYVDAGD
jgi:hypothetical protein